MNLRICGPAHDLRARMNVPGDKSITHRAMILGALAHGTSRLRGFLDAGVTRATLDCLHRLGIDTGFIGPNDLLVHGGRARTPDVPLDCGNSGSTMRMLLGALAPSAVTATLTGSPGLLQRPMGRVTRPLRLMGADIEGTNGCDQPPFIVRGRALHGIHYELPVASAQVKTALLLAACSAEGPTTLSEPGPARDHTERMLRSLGLSLHVNGNRITLTPEEAPLPAFTVRIPGDFSSAAFLLVAGAVVPGSEITIKGVGVNPRRIGLLEALRGMGANLRETRLHQENGEPVADLHVEGGKLEAIQVDGDDVVRMIDEFPAFLVAATQAEGTSVVLQAEELRLKESDRIATMARELRKMGAALEERPDGVIVEGPRRLHSAVVEAHGDHRVAMALAVAALVADGETTIRGAECISESFPGFEGRLAASGAELR